MYYSVIKQCDIADGPGVRVSLFVSGCRRHCNGCHNAIAWDFEYGKEFDSEAIRSIMSCLNNSYIRGLTILGGEPMEPENVEAVKNLCLLVRKEYPGKDIWLYSGYTYEELHEKYGNLMSWVDVLVDGEYDEDKRNISLQYRGSENQRIIDILMTEMSGHIVEWKNKLDQNPDMTMADRL